MVLVDTSVWLDYLKGVASLEARWLFDRLGVETFVLPDLVLCEVLQGAKSESDMTKLRERMSPFEVLDSGGKDLAVSSAINDRLLRSKGLTVRTTIDCIVATLCIERRLRLLHRDRDFDGFEVHLALEVIHPRIQ